MSVQMPLFEKADSTVTKVAARVEEIVGAGFDVQKFAENFEVLVDTASGVKQLRRLVLLQALTRGFECNSIDGWASGKVENFVSLLNGYAFKSEWFATDGVRLVRNANVAHGGLDWTDIARLRHEKVTEFERFALSAGDIVISLDRPIISTGVKVARLVPADLPALLLQRVAKVSASGDVVEPNYLFLWFTSPLFTDAIDPGRSNGVPHISTKQVQQLPMKLPPLAEQKRIVTKVDQLMALCDELEARQTKKRDIGTRLTKSALEALTSAEGPEEFDVAWKRVVDNFGVLVDRAERVGLLRKAVVSLALQGRLVRQLVREGDADHLLSRIAPQAAMPEMSNAGFDSLPDSWRWVPLGAIVTFGPKNGYSPKAVEHETKVKSLTLTATTSGRFDGRFFKYIDEEIPSRSDLWLSDGDLLIQRGNTIEYVGVAAVYRGPPRTFIYPDLMMKVRVHADLDLDYVHMALNGPGAREFIMGRASGTSGSMPKINQGTLLAIPIPLPPAGEQGRISGVVASMMKLCDDLEASLRRAEDRASKLVEAVVSEMVA